MRYQVTFTNRGFIVAVLYNNETTPERAIESAKFYVCNHWTKVRAELIEELV